MVVLPLSQESDRNIWDIIPINCWAKSSYFPCYKQHDNVVVRFQEHLGGRIAKAFQGGAVCTLPESIILSVPIIVMRSFRIESGRLDDCLFWNRYMVMLAKSHQLHIGA